MVIKNQYNWHFTILVLFFFACICSVSAQKEIRVHVSGNSISRDLTPKEALKEAILDAQKNAYKKAGIKEHVSVSSILFTESNGEQVKNYFNEISSIESNANIIVDSVYKEKRSFDDYGNMIMSVEIDATIFKYEKQKDPSFFFKIDDLKDTYYENESISFLFTPSQDGYLKIFAINDSSTILLYPYKNPIAEYLSDKSDSLFKKGVSIKFPIHSAYKPGYSIEINASKETEINTLIFVYLKNDIPWIEREVNFYNILYWMYNITINQRYIQYKSITIKSL
jgi:hypothetical protein